jgi:hypothetical protein
MSERDGYEHGVPCFVPEAREEWWPRQAAPASPGQPADIQLDLRNSWPRTAPPGNAAVWTFV